MAPSTALVLSNSRSNTFRRCEKQYEFKYRLKLKKKESALPLFRGNWLHQLMQVHYDGEDWRERHKILITSEWDNLLMEEKEDLGGDLPTEVERLFKGYLKHYKEADKRWVVVDTELDEVVELPNGQKVRIIIDLIVQDKFTKKLWIVDHKTVGQFYPPEFMLIDSQLALYYWGAEVALDYKNLAGAILNEMITKPPTLPKWLEPSQMYERRKNLHCDAYTYFTLLKANDQDPRKYKAFLQFLKSRHGEWWRRTPMPRDKEMTKQIVSEMMATGKRVKQVEQGGVYIRSARKDCRYDCSFLELCMGELQGLDITSIIDMKYEISKRPDDDELTKLWPSRAKAALQVIN